MVARDLSGTSLSNISICICTPCRLTVKKKSLPRRSYLIYYCYLMKLENGELERYIIGGNDATS